MIILNALLYYCSLKKDIQLIWFIINFLLYTENVFNYGRIIGLRPKMMMWGSLLMKVAILSQSKGVKLKVTSRSWPESRKILGDFDP